MRAGPASAAALLRWEDAELAPLWTEGAPLPAAVSERLAGYAAAIVYSLDPTLPRRLAERIPRVVCHPPLPPPDCGYHASRWACAPLRSFGASPRPADPAPLRPRSRYAGLPALRARLATGYLALHPGSGSPRKNWPPERFRALGEALSPARPWLAGLGPAESDLDFGPAAACVAARDLPLTALAALLADAGLYVGNDSGITHLAAAVGVPTLALFGPSDPGTWAPTGPAVRVLRSPSGRMDALELDVVLAAAEELRSRAYSSDGGAVPSTSL